MKKRDLFIFFLVFASLLNIGCKKSFKFKKKNKTAYRKQNKAGVDVMKPYTAMASATGVFMVTKEHMMNTFKAEANNKPPVYSSFMNNGSSDISINISLDGETWESKEIGLGEKIEVASGGAGVIGIESDSNYYQVEKSDDFLVKEKDGSLTFYSH